MKKVQIVAPGGSYSKAIVASKYGADEVYVGVPFTSLRMRQNKIYNFEDLKRTIDGINANGSKALLTMNIFPRNSDVKVFENVVEQIAEVGADAIIFSDPGTFNVIRKHMPDMNLHLSTQTSTLNYESIKFRYDQGVKRVILARELHLDEIKEIKERVPEMELEVFVHGAMCMSYSGRCLLGDYMAGRQANKGECNHACRFKYKVWLEEERRPGKLFQMKNGDGGVHILSSKDLCTIDHLEKILPHIDAIKIEGRSKSEFYVGAMVKAYKEARDAISGGREPRKEIVDLVNKIPHREYWSGFLFNHLSDFPEREYIDGCHSLEGQYENSTTLDSGGPLFARNYFGIFNTNFIEKDGKKYLEFNPKEVIDRGMELKYLYLGNKKPGKLKIINILDEGGNDLDRATCNTPSVFIYTNKNLQGLEILYE